MGSLLRDLADLHATDPDLLQTEQHRQDTEKYDDRSSYNQVTDFAPLPPYFSKRCPYFNKRCRNRLELAVNLRHGHFKTKLRSLF